jgi:hypothetical protein
MPFIPRPLTSRCSPLAAVARPTSLGVLLLTLHVAAHAAPPLPPSLMYQGKPIDPQCFTAQDHSRDQVSLTSCGIKTEPGQTIVGKNQTLTQQGFFGYDFKIADAGPTQGYSYYRPIAKLDHKDILLTISSGGGSGAFTSLQSSHRKGESIDVDTYNTGDRCNNGLSDVKLIGNTLRYRVNITPFDFLSLAKDNPHQLKAYDDLDACAACCAGTVLMSRPLNQHFAEETIVSVDFSHYVLGLGHNPNQTTYQRCFNGLIKRYQEKHNTILSLDGLKTLTQQFNHQCVTSQ